MNPQTRMGNSFINEIGNITAHRSNRKDGKRAGTAKSQPKGSIRVLLTERDGKRGQSERQAEGVRLMFVDFLFLKSDWDGKRGQGTAKGVNPRLANKKLAMRPTEGVNPSIVDWASRRGQVDVC